MRPGNSIRVGKPQSSSNLFLKTAFPINEWLNEGEKGRGEELQIPTNAYVEMPQ